MCDIWPLESDKKSKNETILHENVKVHFSLNWTLCGLLGESNTNINDVNMKFVLCAITMFGSLFTDEHLKNFVEYEIKNQILEPELWQTGLSWCRHPY